MGLDTSPVHQEPVWSNHTERLPAEGEPTLSPGERMGDSASVLRDISRVSWRRSQGRREG